MLACRHQTMRPIIRSKRRSLRAAGLAQPRHDPAHPARGQRARARRGAGARVALGRLVSARLARRRWRSSSRTCCSSLLLLYAVAPWLARPAVSHRRAGRAALALTVGIGGRASPRCSHAIAAAAAPTLAAPRRLRAAASPRRCSLLFPAARQGAVAGDHRGAAAGAAGAHPAALPVQQHQRGAVAGAHGSAARRDRAARTWRISSAC